MKLALIALATACGAPARPPGQAPPGAPAVHVTIRHLERADAWEIAYRLPAAVREIAFARGSYEFRAAHWTIAGPPGVELVRIAGQDSLRSATPFHELTLRIATYRANPEKDYQVFIPYTDGGELVYTGQFDLEPPGCDAACKHEYALIPRAGEHVVVDGNVATGETRWTSRGDGTYVYFGTAQPVRGDAVIGVVDPGLPAWLRTRVETLLPKLFDFYARELGARLASRPVVYVSYGIEADPKSRSFGGGTLPGVVQLEFRLPRDLQPDAGVAADASHLIAHEAAHLWNTQLYHHEVEHGEWLHEGGADAFAWRALRALDAIDDQRYGDELSRAVSLCLLGLGGEPLHASSRAGRFKNHYTCGATIDLLVEGALRAAGDHGDLFAFWARVFAARKDGSYDERAFLGALRAIASPTAIDGTVALVERILDGPTRELDIQVRAELERLGIHSAVVADPDDHDYRRLAALRAVTAVATYDCGGDPVIEPRNGGARIRDLATCKALGALERIDQLGPYSLAQQGAAAYDHVIDACARTGAVTVRGGDHEATVRCGEPPPRRSPFLRLTGYPR